MKNISVLVRVLLPAAFAALSFISAQGQGILDRRISVDVTNQRLARVLELISNKGSFYFSYNSNIIQRDSLVSFSATEKPVKQVLDQLLKNRYTYLENNNYLILRRAAIQGTVVSNTVLSEEKLYTITGYVMNAMTGEKMRDVSVYEKDRLVSTLTDDQGHFIIKLKSRYRAASLTASKASFADTTITVQPRFNQQIIIAIIPEEPTAATVTISPVDFERPDTINIPVNDTLEVPVLTALPQEPVEKTAAGKFLLSAKQKIQSINLKKFFAERPYQASLLPGIGTQGRLSAQVTNKFSFNVLGGYTGGVQVAELGGLFNINKQSVRYAQVGGLFNITGGTMTGVQIGGIHNTVLDDVNGVQVGGINNYVKGKFTGWQTGGIYNHVTDSLTGLQIGGIANFARRYVYGVQIAGISNVAAQDMEGVQVAGIINYAKKLKGVQIGLINVSDTSEGYSIGLINIIFKGYHKVSFSYNEVMDLNLAFKTGYRKLYSILLVGAGPKKDAKLYSFGYGLGSEFTLSKRFTFNPELTSQYLYMGSWDYTNLLNRLSVNFHVNFGKYFSMFTGPSFNLYHSDQTVAIAGYKPFALNEGYHTFDIGSGNWKGWFGWNIGVSIF